MAATPVEPAAATDPREATSPDAGRSGGRGGGSLAAYYFLLPYLVLFITFVLAPAVFGLYISLHNWDFLLPVKPFVGLENYLDLFRSDSLTFEPFWTSMRATTLFTIYSVPLLLVLPLMIALLLNRKFPGRTFFRAVYFAPYVLGVAVIGVLFRFILDPNIGLLNFMLQQVGVDVRIPWTTAEPWVWHSLVWVTVWWTLGFNAVIYLAGLQEIPRELYEASEVDGASPWRQFWHVTLPGLQPVLLFVTTITVLASANMFGQAFLITQGAPGNDTRTAIMYIAEEGLSSFRMGNAAAMSYLLMLLLILISLGIAAVFRRLEQ